jgi:hypothetical protein
MDSVTNNVGITQLRCRAIAGGRQPLPFSYDLIVFNAGKPTNYQPVADRVEIESTWRELNNKGAAAWMKIVSLWIAATAISMGLPCMLSDGTERKAASFSCVTDIRMSACSPSSNSGKNLRGCHEH